jgi:predicted phosphodiesterase
MTGMPPRLAIAFLVVSAASAAQHAWVELAPSAGGTRGYKILARYAESAGDRCPNIILDGVRHRMMRRTPTGTFNALICETTVPASVHAASIGPMKLPLPKWRKNASLRVVVIGDTGCRVKKGSDDPTQTTGAATWNLQNCQSPKDWPFAEVAASSAATKPDLIIHVGDYLYRERNCAGVNGCPGGPSGDTFETWEADFFTPARELLSAAPWVVVRGNHESCARAGNGWFSLLDPRPMPTCEDFTAPYLIQAGNLPLAVLDDSTATDAMCRPDDAACAAQFAIETDKYTEQFRTISSWNMKEAWLLSHRPIWSIKKGGDGLQVLNAVLESAWDRARPQGVELLLAGHTHVFEMIGFTKESGHATQLVIGNSGTKLAPRIKFDPKSADVKRASIQDFRNLQDFGFTTLTTGAGTWRVEAHDRAGQVQFACTLPFTGARCGQ